MTADLSQDQARRIALAAQGFAQPRPVGRVDRRHLRTVLGHVGVIQVDSVNVLARSQELVLFARLGPHPRSLIGDASRDGELFEYWVHEASLVPTAHHHLWRWKMREPYPWPSFRRRVAAMGPYLEEVFQRVADDGPLVVGDVDGPGSRGGWWDHGDGKAALAALFYLGRITARRRPRDFARTYDLPERVIPAEVLARPAVPEHEARKELLALAAEHHGVATAADLADYHRFTRTACREPLAELVEEGRLVPVAVEGWDAAGYLHPDARQPRTVDARALVSPFDSLVWTRERTLRLFDLHYRIEIYTPPAKRRFGYYVLPFLLGDRLVGRVDLKADRAGGALLVQAAWIEPDVAAGEATVAGELLAELRLLARWLELDRIEVTGQGDLGPRLQRLTRKDRRR